MGNYREGSGIALTVSKMPPFGVLLPGVVSSAEIELVLTFEEVTADVSAVVVRGTTSVSVDVSELQRVDFPVEYFFPNPRTRWFEKKTITLRKVRPRYCASCDFCWLVGRGLLWKIEIKPLKPLVLIKSFFLYGSFRT